MLMYGCLRQKYYCWSEYAGNIRYHRLQSATLISIMYCCSWVTMHARNTQVSSHQSFLNSFYTTLVQFSLKFRA